MRDLALHLHAVEDKSKRKKIMAAAGRISWAKLTPAGQRARIARMVAGRQRQRAARKGPRVVRIPLGKTSTGMFAGVVGESDTPVINPAPKIRVRVSGRRGDDKRNNGHGGVAIGVICKAGSGRRPAPGLCGATRTAARAVVTGAVGRTRCRPIIRAMPPTMSLDVRRSVTLRLCAGDRSAVHGR